MKSDYHERKQRRIERFAELAEKNAAEADQRFNTARQTIAAIPPGQPILIGHHSEGRHRRDLARHDANMRKGVEATKKADYYADRAHSAETNTAISSDDPEAVVKLRAKIADAETSQERMKAINAAWRKAGKPLAYDREIDQAAWETALENASETAKPLLVQALAEKRRDFWNGQPYTYQMSNNNANIKRMKDRLATLEREASAPHKEYEINGVSVVESPEDNRLQIYFDGKPDEATRALLKSRGFRWARSLGCWQRHLSNAARYEAEYILNKTTA